MGIYRRPKVLLFLFMLVALTGCGGLTDSRTFTNPQADFSFYQRVGMIQFKNYSEDKLAGEKLSEHFMTEVLIGGELDMMDQGQFNAVVAQVLRTNAPVAGIDLSTAHLTQVGEFAKVQGIFMGTIHEYKMVQVAGEQYPLISMTIKFIDAPTGTVAWQKSISMTGGPNLPILSIGETFTLGVLSQKISEKIVKDFLKALSR